MIDEECFMCPFSIKKKKKKKKKVKFSDHNAIVVRLNIEHEKKKVANIAKSWRITNEGMQKLIMATNETFNERLNGGIPQSKISMRNTI